ncbi:MAG: hypothetical protein HUK22_02455, partial [Thermoguttaceae bacterium]|nr:hypothetical protein [Thermoguttaceae bacterium]
LREGGKMLIPIGERYEQYFVLCEKKNGELVKNTLTPACFVPMTGQAETMRDIQPDPANPHLVGGDFEEANPTAYSVEPTATWKTDSPSKMQTPEEALEAARSGEIDELSIQLPARRPTPRGWYFTRNVYLEERPDAPQGSRVCVFDNASVAEEHRKKDVNAARIAAATPPEKRATSSYDSEAMKQRQREQEMSCSMRQNFAVDGAKVKKLAVSGTMCSEILEAADGRKTVTVIRIGFFDKNRDFLGRETVVLAVSPGVYPWRDFNVETAVPRRAAEASLQVGILDGVGKIAVDNLKIANKYEKK